MNTNENEVSSQTNDTSLLKYYFCNKTQQQNNSTSFNQVYNADSNEEHRYIKVIEEQLEDSNHKIQELKSELRDAITRFNDPNEKINDKISKLNVQSNEIATLMTSKMKLVE